MNDPHLRRLHAALREEEQAVRAHHQHVSSLPLSDRVALGHAWAPVTFEVVDEGRRHIEVVVRGELHEGIGPGSSVVVGSIRGRCLSWDSRAAELRMLTDVKTWGTVPTGAAVELALDTRRLVAMRKDLEAADEFSSELKRALLDGPVWEEQVESHEWPDLLPGQAAVADRAVAAEALGVIHGPPGTGKTRTLAAILARLVADGERPWALAESNAAVDHLAATAAARGLRVVRLGPTHRVGTAAAALTLEARVAEGAHAGELAALKKQIGRARKGGGPTLWRLLDAQREARQRAAEHVIRSAEVVATTFGSLSHWGETLGEGQTAVVDEVTQVVEPALWGLVPRVQRMILAGDPHQLGPVVIGGNPTLEQSVLHRFEHAGHRLPMLTVQHRMNCAIQALVKPVYGEDYTASGAAAERMLAGWNGVTWTGPELLFIDTAGAGEEEKDPVTHSTFNRLECRLVGQLLDSLWSAGVPRESVGVIAPYTAQVRRLSALPQARGVEVATVNAFQGREAEVIVVSFTRSNADAILGFVDDRRRLTVAVTRARRALFLVGDSTTIGASAAIAEVLDALPAQSVWEPPWDVCVES